MCCIKKEKKDLKLTLSRLTNHPILDIFQAADIFPLARGGV